LNLGHDKNEADYDREFFVTGCGPISLQSRKFSKWIWSTRQVNGTDWQEQQI